MAGKRETPRQKMIGMMYLVLTALLALNVSKEVIAAFVTINDKLNASSAIISIKSDDIYNQFEQKKAGLLAAKSSLDEFNIWHQKAIDSKNLTSELVNFIMSESNEMIKEAEGKDWVESRDENGYIQNLKPLIDIRNMDNYDIPTSIFVGSNPTAPNERGLALQSKIHSFRDSICRLMGNITYGGKNYTFTPPAAADQLEDALKSVLPEDRTKIKQVYTALSTPKTLKSHSKYKEQLPWASVMFDHAPIVAAASLLNALKLDIKNSEAEVSSFFLAKVKAPKFIFNKIEPLPFASTRYINSGDSLAVNVMIAAYDSNAVKVIRYGIDNDTIENKWIETNGPIQVKGTAGNHTIKGAIGVEEQGVMKWKPWRFNYTVGKPMGAIAQPEMRVLYKGYDNLIEASASGFPSDRISVSGSGCTVRRKSGQQYEVRTNRGSRSASITIHATKDNGSKVNLGTYSYQVRPMPRAVTYLGSIKNGDSPRHSTVVAQTRTSIRFGRDVILRQVPFDILGGTVKVEGLLISGKINPGGSLDAKAKRAIRQSKGKEVTIKIKYRDPSGYSQNAETLTFTSI